MFVRSTIALAAALSLIVPSVAFAATPIGAKVIFVRGKAEVVRKVDGVTHPLVLGDDVAAGDTIVTGRDGEVEIRFDNNDQIKIDRRTRLKVQSLHRDDKGSTFSIFGLMFGRVKSAVNKLLNNDSRFEYQTKAAVAGVAGTPPWVIGFDVETEVTEVDLLGTQGEEGAVSVQGVDGNQSRVLVMPGMRTVIRPGGAPQSPFRISPARLRSLNNFRFRVPPQPKVAPPTPTPEPAKKDEEQKTTSPTKDILKTQAAHTVSKPSKLAPTSEKNAGDFNANTSSQQGTVGEVGGQNEAPLPATYRIEVDFR